MSEGEQEIVPFNKIQGIASTNVPAYSNESDDFVSFERFYVHGIYTGYKWQCVEFARRWLLLRKSCIFQNIGFAADMWQQLNYVERVTDAKKFHLKNHSNGSPHKPQCGALLIYPSNEEAPHGHVAVICEVQENFIRIVEQNYQFHYWSGDYARQIPMIYRNGLYYIQDQHNVYGWMEIENNNQLKPLDESNINFILPKYQQPSSTGELQRCCIMNKTFDNDYLQIDVDNGKENFLSQSDDNDIYYYKANEDFFVNISSTSNELYRLFLQVTDHIIHNDELLTLFEIPNEFWFRIRRSWIDEQDFDLIDHVSFNFDGQNLKLHPYESNHALTILQSAIAQEKQAQTMNLNYDFMSSFQLHHLLVRQWKRLNIKTIIHILIDNNEEDLETISYIQKVMSEAGINSKLCLWSNDLYWKDSMIVDKDGEIVKTVWKLWNWETIFQNFTDQYRNNTQDNEWELMNGERSYISDILLNEQIRIIEPLWKSITNHSAFLSILYEMFPNHPNIVQDQWMSSERSEHLPCVDRSTIEHSNGIIKSHDAKENIIINDGMDEYLDYDYISQKIMSGKSSDEIIVSLMIHGLCSGHCICEDQNDFTNTKNSKTCFCII
ncbi:unnamed protein product [Rotaria sp. Silwood2]|nr:unnamed protein product [Rotaria sp. Silwood2]CAF4081266.1 unnamed protein product [Rotaria sp. Silwood2]